MTFRVEQFSERVLSAEFFKFSVELADVCSESPFTHPRYCPRPTLDCVCFLF